MPSCDHKACLGGGLRRTLKSALASFIRARVHVHKTSCGHLGSEVPRISQTFRHSPNVHNQLSLRQLLSVSIYSCEPAKGDGNLQTSNNIFQQLVLWGLHISILTSNACVCIDHLYIQSQHIQTCSQGLPPLKRFVQPNLGATCGNLKWLVPKLWFSNPERGQHFMDSPKYKQRQQQQQEQLNIIFISLNGKPSRSSELPTGCEIVATSSILTRSPTLSGRYRRQESSDDLWCRILVMIFKCSVHEAFA